MKGLGFSIFLFTAVALSSFAGDGKHLFILSGQSNMARFNPVATFIPAVEKEFGKTNVIVVKDAQGGMPICCWYKKWKDGSGVAPAAIGDLYDRLMRKVNSAIENQQIATVTFIWMQGERDAGGRYGDVYEASLNGLVKQLSDDLGRHDVNVVIGRLSDFDLKNERYLDWTKVREAQVHFAETYSRGAWINTDDCNTGPDGKNDLHMSVEGYKLMGKRYAEKAILLIKKNQAE